MITILILIYNDIHVYIITTPLITKITILNKRWFLLVYFGVVFLFGLSLCQPSPTIIDHLQVDHSKPYLRFQSRSFTHRSIGLSPKTKHSCSCRFKQVPCLTYTIGKMPSKHFEWLFSCISDLFGNGRSINQTIIAEVSKHQLPNVTKC